MTPEWILAIAAVVTILGGVFGFLIKIVVDIKVNTNLTQAVHDRQKEDREQISKVVSDVSSLKTRMGQLETWREIHAHEKVAL